MAHNHNVYNIDKITLFNITYGDIKRIQNKIIVPIGYNDTRFLIKVTNTECILYEPTYIALRGEELEKFICNIENKIVNDIKKLGKKWNLPNNLKYVSLITEYKDINIIKIAFNEIKPVIYNNKNEIIEYTLSTKGTMKSLLEVKDLVIDNTTKLIYINIVIHQLKFIELETFTQITEYVLSDSSVF